MKNLKKLLGLMVVSVMALSVMGTANATTCSGDACHVKATIKGSKNGSETGTYAELTDVVDEISARITGGETISNVEVTLLADTVTTKTVTTDAASGTGINCPVTINLAGHELSTKVANPFVVLKNGSLTINGSGTGSQVAYDTTAAVELVNVQRGGTFKTAGKVNYILAATDTFVKTDDSAGSGRITVITDASTSLEAAKVAFDVEGYADVTVAGTYETAEQLVTVANNTSKTNASVINVNATATTTGAAEVFSVSDYAKLNINGGKYTADAANQNVMTINDPSAVVINNGTFVATSGTATTVGYAVFLGTNADVKINGGNFTSGEGADGEYLPALFVTTMSENKAAVTAGTFNYGMVATSTTSGTHGNPDNDKNIAELVATTSTYTVNKDNGTVVVKAGAATDPEKDPETKPGTGDDQPSENPKTFDAIGSLVTMAISSLGVVGTATKKLFR